MCIRDSNRKSQHQKIRKTVDQTDLIMLMNMCRKEGFKTQSTNQKSNQPHPEKLESNTHMLLTSVLVHQNAEQRRVIRFTMDNFINILKTITYIVNVK